MSRSVRALAVALVVVLAAAAPAAARPTPAAQRVLRHGYVYTVDAHRPVAQALAVRGGRIVYVGSNRGVRRFIGARTRVIDLRGRMVMRGLIDGHVHPQAGGAAQDACSLGYEQLTIAKLLSGIKACIADTTSEEPDGWLEVGDWDLQGMKPAGTVPSRADLDSLSTRRPIAVYSTDGHNLLANSRALALAGIDRTTPDPPSGAIVRDASGEPTGLIKDNAVSLVSDRIPAPTLAENVRSLRVALRLLNEVGVTSLFDAGGPGPRPYAVLRRRGQLTARVSVGESVEPADAGQVARTLKRLRAERRRYDGGKLHLDTVGEVFFDGVAEYPTQTRCSRPTSRSAADAGSRAATAGRGTSPAPRRARSSRRWIAAAGGFTSTPSATGRCGRRSTASRKANGRRGNPVTLVHLELIDPADVPRFERLGVIANFQLQWAQRDAYTIDNLEDYIGPKRLSRLYPAGDLLRAGAYLAGGSDWNVDPLNPWRYVEQAVTRTGVPGYDAYRGRLGPRQAIGLRAAIAMNTLHAARQLRLQRETGSLTVGKQADLLVLDRNLLRIPVKRIHATKVLLTMLGGRVVHRARGL